MEDTGLALLQYLNQFRDRISAHMGVGELTEADKAVWLYGHGLVEIRGKTKNEIEDVPCPKLVARIGGLEHRLIRPLAAICP